MLLLYRNFRRWWQPPRNIRDREQHRQVAFLELFYDLVYVVLIAELAHALAEHVDLEHIVNFAFLFIIVWWAWINGTFYHDLHGNNDIRTRVFTFLQMSMVASMAVFAHNAIGDEVGSKGFALSYAGFQLILTYLWWRTGVYDPEHRPLSRPYVAAFLITTTLFIVSVFVEEPMRYYLWVAAVLLSLVLPILTSTRFQNRPELQTQIELSRTPTPSLVERFGLFTIIVLGEVIVGVVQGVTAHHDLSLELGGISLLGMSIAFGLWWVYFDFVSHRLPRTGSTPVSIWMYAHLPLTIGIASTGAAVLNVVEHAGEALPLEVRWLLVGAIAIALVSITILIQTLQKSDNLQQTYRIGQVIILVSALLIILLGASDLETTPLLVIIIVLMLAPVFFGLLSWVKGLETQNSQ